MVFWSTFFVVVGGFIVLYSFGSAYEDYRMGRDRCGEIESILSDYGDSLDRKRVE